MYTITRKLAMVCLAVVFSVLVYGCGGGGNGQADMVGTDSMPTTAEQLKLALESLAAAEEAKDAAVAAEATAVAAQEAAEDDASLAVAAQEAAVAAQEKAQNALDDLNEALEVVNSIVVELAMGYRDVDLGVQMIEPGDPVSVGEGIEATCTGSLCVLITKLEAGERNYTSLGGELVLQNTGVVIETLTAIALSDGTNGALRDGTLTMDSNVPDNTETVVERGPDGVTMITLKDDMADMAEYSPEDVDPGHEIDGWMGQTLTRHDGIEATEDDEAVQATIIQEATVYTNIDAAEEGKWEVTGDTGEFAVPDTTIMAFLIDADQDLTNVMDEDTFTGAYVRENGEQISGTFTCDTNCTQPTTMEGDLLAGGLSTLDIRLVEGWTFVSDEIVKEGNKKDPDYMHFGYWLKSPVEHSTDAMDYHFTAFSGGKALIAVHNDLVINTEDALKATYKGGAAGRYVTRDLRVVDGMVDPNSPGSHGRFTAKTELTAYFSNHDDFNDVENDVDNGNMIHGTIKEFKDGDTDLGFDVTLGPNTITSGNSPITSTNMGMTTFNDGDVTGSWSANFYGPGPDPDDDMATDANTLPSGVAGRFNVGSDSTKIVGAYAAEKQ